MSEENRKPSKYSQKRPYRYSEAYRRWAQSGSPHDGMAHSDECLGLPQERLRSFTARELHADNMRREGRE
jgi:hypothetical protein